MKEIAGGITAPQGFVAGGIACGIKSEGLDLALIKSEVEHTALAAIFTKNTLAAAPVKVARETAAASRAQAIVANSGNANAGNGRKGLDDARRMRTETAAALGVEPNQVLIASTGIIGHPLPIDRISAALPKLTGRLSRAGGADAAQAIMTTDTRPKQYAVELEIGGIPCRIGGIAKGAGMIAPNLATMLVFLSTDVHADPKPLGSALKAVAEATFNQMTVDNCQSTNDTVAILANGAAGNKLIRQETSAGYIAFTEALEQVCLNLMKQLLRDAEGATKVISVHVVEAENAKEARTLARAVACSDLFRCAVYGADPNWGRIVSAMGSTGISIFENALAIRFGEHVVVEKGAPVPQPPESVVEYLQGSEIEVTISLGIGRGRGRAYTCDLTEGYIRINAHYHT